MRVSPPGRSTARRRWPAAVAAVIGLAVLLGACGGVLGSIISTRQSLDDAGYSHVSVGTTDDNVKVSVSLDQDASPAQVREVAAIVWRDFHERFAAVEITLHGAAGTVHQTLGFAQLQQVLGARPAADNRTTLRDGIIRTGVVILVVAAVVVLVVAVVVVLIVRRRRRRRPAGVWSGPGGPWGPGGPGAPGGRGGPGERAGGAWGPPAESAPGWGSPPARDPWEPPPGSGPPAW